MTQDFSIRPSHDMMGFVNQNELKVAGIEFCNSVFRKEASNRSNCDIGCPCSVAFCHLNVNRLCWVCYHAVASSLLNKFLAMDKYKSLFRCFSARANTFDQLRKDNLAI